MSGPRIVIVDYQAGNLRSVHKALERFGADAVVTCDPGDIVGADGLVFPGQGANDSSMRHLRTRGLVEPIRDFVSGGRPFLGVCLGLQLLFEGSDEGVEPGLGLLDGWVRRLPAGVKVPHMVTLAKAGLSEVKTSAAVAALTKAVSKRKTARDVRRQSLVEEQEGREGVIPGC